MVVDGGGRGTGDMIFPSSPTYLPITFSAHCTPACHTHTCPLHTTYTHTCTPTTCFPPFPPLPSPTPPHLPPHHHPTTLPLSTHLTSLHHYPSPPPHLTLLHTHACTCLHLFHMYIPPVGGWSGIGSPTLRSFYFFLFRLWFGWFLLVIVRSLRCYWLVGSLRSLLVIVVGSFAVWFGLVGSFFFSRLLRLRLVMPFLLWTFRSLLRSVRCCLRSFTFLFGCWFIFGSLVWLVGLV